MYDVALLLSLASFPIASFPQPGGEGSAELLLRSFDELKSCGVDTRCEQLCHLSVCLPVWRSAILRRGYRGLGVGTQLDKYNQCDYRQMLIHQGCHVGYIPENVHLNLLSLFLRYRHIGVHWHVGGSS